jgi:hypothetical protein
MKTEHDKDKVYEKKSKSNHSEAQPLRGAMAERSVDNARRSSETASERLNVEPQRRNRHTAGSAIPAVNWGGN